MKRLVIASLFATALLGAQAQSFTDQARVRSVDPQYENINVPRNECSSHWVTETQRVDTERSYGGAIVGGVAGGIIGNQVGKGHGRDAATALGAVVGAIAGDRLDNRDRRDRYYEPSAREVKRCRTVYDTQSRITGYRVNYEYRGQHYSTVTRENPGNSLTVRVSVEPIER
ncbi:MAG: glycine zipper 2TM domain-containing protein [Rhodoferax sp.]|nr:glycine zipper 2TM domain-containing protein [Rhodoferax sp.]